MIRTHKMLKVSTMSAVFILYYINYIIFHSYAPLLIPQTWQNKYLISTW